MPQIAHVQLFYILAVSFLPYLRSNIVNVRENYSLRRFDVQNSSLTITSFQFNPTSTSSEWIDRIFGSKSIFYPNRALNKIISGDPLTKEETTLGISIASKTFSLPADIIWPACSIELLGYSLLGVSHPISEEARSSGPSFGHGRLRLALPHKDWGITCYYRALYENWRPESSYTSPNYWATVIFCPVKNAGICERLGVARQQDEVIPMEIEIQLETATWTAKFTPNFKTRKQSTLSLKNAHSNKSQPPKLGICLAIPYTSNDPAKVPVNKALLNDWIRYYIQLDYVVMVYDRDGSNYDAIFNSKRFKFPDQMIQKNLAYYNYTIRGLLDTSKRGMKYDNGELKLMIQSKSLRSAEAMNRRTRFESQGHDKVLTLTHCRFEAKATYGIDTVLVADFDEFLYCPFGGANKSTQGAYMRQYFNYNRKYGVDQITIPQRFITNKTTSTNKCIRSKVELNQPIFDCFAPYYYYMGGHSVKSAHLGHKCPLTGYHQACPMIEAPRSYDCLCVNKNLRHILPWRGPNASNENRECGFVHVSLDDSNYVKFTYSETDIKTILASPNEIGQIIYSR